MPGRYRFGIGKMSTLTQGKPRLTDVFGVTAPLAWSTVD
jgi:hypothetical protein